MARAKQVVAQKSHKILRAALIKMLRPLARILMNHGMGWRTFSDVARWAFVESAMEDFGAGAPLNKSRIALLTGIPRREVQKICEMEDPGEDERLHKMHRAARVTQAWASDRFFQDNGKPAVLPMRGRRSFAELVKRFGSDVPPRTILDELLDSETAEYADNHHRTVRLTAKSYVPPKSTSDERLRSMGETAAHLLDSIAFNLDPDAEVRFQREVLAKVAKSDLENVVAQLQRCLERARDCAEGALGKSGGRGSKQTAGVGLYLFHD